MEKLHASFSNDGIILRGWFVRPHEDDQTPIIILIHGLSGIADFDLADYAERFVSAGFACFAYDHRNWGASDGEPRSETDPWRQVEDLRAAISFVRNQSWVDPDRVGLWGTSYGGGHVLTVAALDSRLKCAVSQVPLVSGSKTFDLWIPQDKQKKFLLGLGLERDARARGETPATVPAAREGSDTAQWVATKDIERRYVNELTTLSFDFLRSYEPQQFAPQIDSIPLLMIIATEDTQTPTAWQRETFAIINSTKQLVEIDGAHYDVYMDKLEPAAQAALSWFRQYL